MRIHQENAYKHNPNKAQTLHTKLVTSHDRYLHFVSYYSYNIKLFVTVNNVVLLIGKAPDFSLVATHKAPSLLSASAVGGRGKKRGRGAFDVSHQTEVWCCLKEHRIIYSNSYFILDFSIHSFFLL